MPEQSNPEQSNLPSLAELSRAKTLRFLQDLDGSKFTDLYKSVMCEAELGLLLAVMNHTGGNQSKAARLLGITRTTLRQKLRHHKLNGAHD